MNHDNPDSLRSHDITASPANIVHRGGRGSRQADAARVDPLHEAAHQEILPPRSAAAAAPVTRSALVVALRTTVVTLLLTGVAYPLLITGLSQTLFSDRANGSLVTDDGGHVIGSSLIGQAFSNPAYFWPRPSSAGSEGYDGTASGGSNLGPTSQKLRDRITIEAARLHAANPEAPRTIPIELVTTSASGLDPHLSPAAALWQSSRVARARGVTSDRIRHVVESQVEGRTFGILGERRVNVLLLNLALDRQFGRPTASP